MKKILFSFLSITLFVFLMTSSSYAQTVCWVTHNQDSVNQNGNASHTQSLRAYLQVIDNSHSGGHSTECSVYPDSPDDRAGFDDVIWFRTSFYLDENSQQNAVNAGSWPHITMSDSEISLVITHDLKIGNASTSMLQDYSHDSFPNSEYSQKSYLSYFTRILVAQGYSPPESDFVVVDARAANLTCESNGGHIWLADTLLLTGAGEKMGEGCWKNFGNGFVCDGALKDGQSPLNYADPHGADYLKWCDSLTVEDIPDNPEDQCQNMGYKYFDADHDGFGDPNRRRPYCLDKPRNTPNSQSRETPVLNNLMNRLDQFFVLNADDCDDTNAAVNPDADEICDGLDNDCNNAIDDHSDFSRLNESCSTGIGACEGQGTYVCRADGLSVECNAVAGQPKEEICDNGLDEDCNGTADDISVCTEEDDNPDTPDNPDNPDDSVEICNNVDGDNNPVDDDDDGFANCEDSDCARAAVCIVSREPDETCSTLDDGTPNCQDIDCWAEEACLSSITDDLDGDGFTIQDGDCADDLTLFPNAREINPGTDEICDAIDNNCDGAIDENNICISQSPGIPDETTTSGGGCQLLIHQKSSSQNIVLFMMIIMPLFVLVFRNRNKKFR